MEGKDMFWQVIEAGLQREPIFPAQVECKPRTVTSLYKCGWPFLCCSFALLSCCSVVSQLHITLPLMLWRPHWSTLCAMLSTRCASVAPWCTDIMLWKKYCTGICSSMEICQLPIAFLFLPLSRSTAILLDLCAAKNLTCQDFSWL